MPMSPSVMSGSHNRHGKKEETKEMSFTGLKDHTMSLNSVNVHNKTLSRITDDGLLDPDSEAYGPRERHRTSSSNSSLAVEPGILELRSQGRNAERLNREREMATLLVSARRDSERDERRTIRRSRGKCWGNGCHGVCLERVADQQAESLRSNLFDRRE